MKTRNMILSGVMAVALAAMLVHTAIAETVPDGSDYTDNTPRIFYLKRALATCQREPGLPGFIQGDGGSTPDVHGGTEAGDMGYEDVQNAGCIEWLHQERTQSYIFTGEQMAVLAVARDPNGAAFLRDAYVLVDGDRRVICEMLSVSEADAIANGAVWNGHIVSADLDRYPEIYMKEAGAIPRGYDPAYDRIYECLLTVTDDMEGDVTLEVEDNYGCSDPAMVPEITFNPPVSLNIDTSDGDPISFPESFAGDTVDSVNTLIIKNDGSKVEIAVWLGGSDLVSPDMEARCPVSNVLDVDKYMKFSCVYNDIYDPQHWDPVENKDLTDHDGCWMPIPNGGKANDCFGLEPIFEADPAGQQTYNILMPGDKAECEFRLEYPNPCFGEFSSGVLNILMRAV